MNEQKESRDLAITYRLGRHVIDGATFPWLVKHFGLTVSEVEAAWEYYCEQISHHLAAEQDSAYRLLSDDEIAANGEIPLRLLLEQQEHFERLAQFQSFETNAREESTQSTADDAESSESV